MAGRQDETDSDCSFLLNILPEHDILLFPSADRDRTHCLRGAATRLRPEIAKIGGSTVAGCAGGSCPV